MDKTVITENQFHCLLNEVISAILECDDPDNRDGNENDAYFAFYNLQDFIKEEDIPFLLRRKAMDLLVQYFHEDDDAFDDHIVETCELLAITRGEKIYFADLICKNNNFYINKACAVYREYGMDEEYLSARLKRLEFAEDYIDLANYYKANGEEEKAMSVIQDALSSRYCEKEKIDQWLIENLKERIREHK